MDLRLDKTKKIEIETISKIYKEEFSKPPYNENWTLKKARNKMNFFYKFYDLYTIKIERKIIGFICINQNFMCPGQVAFGEEFAIKQEFQNKGIGTYVLKEIFKIYEKRGYQRFMGIADTKSRAMNLYKKLKIFPSKKDILIERSLK